MLTGHILCREQEEGAQFSFCGQALFQTIAALETDEMHLSIKLSTGEILLDELQTIASQTLQLSMLPQSMGESIEISKETIGKRTYLRFVGDIDLNGQKVESVTVEFFDGKCSGCHIHLYTEMGSSAEKMLDFLTRSFAGKAAKDEYKNARLCYEWGAVTLKEERYYDALSLEIGYKTL